jgi:hypothetical protein
MVLYSDCATDSGTRELRAVQTDETKDQYRRAFTSKKVDTVADQLQEAPLWLVVMPPWKLI